MFELKPFASLVTNTWGVTALPPYENLALRFGAKDFLREEKHVIHFPISAIALGYLASSIREANLVKTLSNTCSS